MIKKFEKFNETTTSIDDLYIIGYGLGGGFGGIQDYEVVEAMNMEDAERQAYDSACDMYEGYDGSNGLMTIDEIMEEEEIEDYDEAEEMWREEREGWLDYSTERWSKKAEESAEG